MYYIINQYDEIVYGGEDKAKLIEKLNNSGLTKEDIADIKVVQELTVYKTPHGYEID